MPVVFARGIDRQVYAISQACALDVISAAQGQTKYAFRAWGQCLTLHLLEHTVHPWLAHYGWNLPERFIT